MVSLKRDPNPGTTPASGAPIRGDMYNEMLDRFGAERFTADKALASNPDGLMIVTAVTRTELGYLSGALSNIQTQINAKFTNNVSATDRVLGRDTAGAGVIEELTVTGGLEFNGGPGIQRSALTGDVTASAGSNSTTIANDAVSYAKMQNVSATSRFIGRITGGAGDPEELTGTQATTLLDTFTSALKGLAPASGGGTANFLRADGVFAAPPAGGSLAINDLTDVTITSPADNQVLSYDSGSAQWINETPGGASVDIKQTEVDFGTTPVSSATFTITDAGVSGTSQLIAQVAFEAPTGKDVDEIEMDNLQIRCKPAAGSFDMYIETADGSYLADKFKINYLIG